MDFFGVNTAYLSELMHEVEVDPATFRFKELLPDETVPSRLIAFDVIEAAGGMTKEHALDADPQSVAKRGWHTKSFSPGSYRETLGYAESEILFLRELGQNDPSKRGITQRLEADMKKLKNRIEVRKEFLRASAIFNGSFTYDGKVVDFGIPGSNSVTVATAWATRDGNGKLSSNPNAFPLNDLWDVTQGGYGPFLKYGNFKEMWMNPNTARMLLQNTNVQKLVAPALGRMALPGLGLNDTLKLVVPGMPNVEIITGNYANEAQDPTTGIITVGSYNYFLPDGKVLLVPNLPDGNGLGNLVMTMNLVEGTVAAPGMGEYLIMDNTLERTRKNAKVEMIAGFTGGPVLKRSQDLLTLSVF